MTRLKQNARRGARSGAGSVPSTINSQPSTLEDFEALAAEDGIQVEHLTIPGFLRRIPHRWHMDEVTRFGDKVGRAAEAMQLSYITAIDRCLGVIRVFPLPLLQRVYAIMAPQLGWPQIVDVPKLQEGPREELRTVEGAKKHLTAAGEHAVAPEVTAAVNTVLTWLDSETQRLRGETPPEPAPLRSI